MKIQEFRSRGTLFFVLFAMDQASRFESLIAPQIPKNAIPYCVDLWRDIPFSFKITGKRKTKLGDFRFHPDRSIQTITINRTLNPYQFLLTFIHEYAHLATFNKHGGRVSPHGKEWKSKFQQLMSPLLQDDFFPRDLLIPLQRHMRAPKASSSRDLFLMKEMSKYDLEDQLDQTVFLSDLRPGIAFELSGRIFKKGETRRTRVLCEEVKTGKKYLIAQLAKVKSLN
ncbi:SprT-like domain-containing protein [Algoriphagus namhaensis]|uniref:SprT-like domain-containing protein n=1 Tax=Algoriphagus namhaensis TaxID=915353 RepID=A0ABV8AP41_9BACT